MSLLSRASLWLARLALGVSGAVLLLIAHKFISDPVGAAAASHTRLESAIAVTNMRASFGAFPLGVAIVALASLTSRRFYLSGLLSVSAVLFSALAVRTYGVVADGTLRESRTVLIAEASLLLLCFIAIGLGTASGRRRHSRGRKPNATSRNVVLRATGS
jgi:hypothetical protein